MVKVSIVIPAYNAMTYLPTTIESVFSQSFNDYEMIIVDDGSSDNTLEWVNKITDARVRVISQANQGASWARNAGIEHSQGEYIAFLDADDIWHPSKLEKQVDCLDAHPEVGLVYTWTELIDSKGLSTGRVFFNNDEGNIWQVLTQHNIIECGSVAMVRRACFEKVGLFDLNLSRSYVEDWDMWLRIATCYPFKVVKEALVFYRQHTNSSSKNWKAIEACFAIVIEKAFQNLPKELVSVPQQLKNQSYANANIFLAWKALQSQAKDYQTASYFRNVALQYYPKLRFSKEFIRLSLAIAILRWFGVDNYSKFLEFVYAMRRSTANPL
ncbi:MAG: glycosyltransferase [Scytonematopsis contorta HA4267-MV1]|jgi:glycosyltransferase involved in cell wall biosynthesis|nr:glycosyltransferase [Scytonematopsis contorta HA4267-MV1]